MSGIAMKGMGMAVMGIDLLWLRTDQLSKAPRWHSPDWLRAVANGRRNEGASLSQDMLGGRQ